MHYSEVMLLETPHDNIWQSGGTTSELCARGWSASCPSHCAIWGKNPLYPPNRLSGPHSWSEHSEEGIKLFPCSELNYQSLEVQPISESLYWLCRATSFICSTAISPPSVNDKIFKHQVLYVLFMVNSMMSADIM